MTLLYSEHKRLYFWNLLVTACSTWMALSVPLGIVLPSTLLGWVKVMYLMTCSVLLVDIGIRYRRFQQEPKEEDASKPFPFLLFAMDIAAAIPYGLIPGVQGLVLMHLIKLWRVSRDIHQFRQAEVKYSISITLLAFVFWSTILIHILACGWLWIHGIATSTDSATNYVTSLYWTVTTLTSVGYGDIVPTTNAQRLYAIMVELSGIGMFGYLIGNVVTILSRLDAAQLRFKEHVEMLGTATKRRGLSKDLQRRTLDYYRYMRDEKTGYDESAFLQTLPETLRTEVALHLKKEFIEHIPLFTNASDKFIFDIALKLQLIVATPGDYIFHVDDPADKMYFVVSGTLEVLNRKDEMFATLKSGDFFGEIALFRNTTRTASIRALTYCNLYKLNRKTFESTLTLYPEVAEKMREEARQREERNSGGMEK